MKVILTLKLLIVTQLSIAQMFPWQPNEVVPDEKDTFFLVERVEFDSNSSLRWLTQYQYDDRGVNVRKIQFDGTTKGFYEEKSICEDDSSRLQRKYRKYTQEHQDSCKRLESLSSYDQKNRLLWECKYNVSGELIDSLYNIYSKDVLIEQNTWSSSTDLFGTVIHEQISKTRIIHSDTGEFRIVSFVNLERYHNGMELKSSSTTTYQYDLNQNLIVEHYYWNDPMAGAPVSVPNSDGIPKTSTQTADDTLRKIILREYDANGNIVYASHSGSLNSEPFLQVYYEYDKKERLVKSYQVNAEGFQTGVTLIDHRRRGENTEVKATRIGDKYVGEQMSISLIDVKGRYLESSTFYEGAKATTDEWKYSQNGGRYQVELKQHFFDGGDGDSEMVLTRWIYEKR